MKHIQQQHVALFLLRVTLGWLCLYAGLTKITDPTWTAAGYLGNAQTFPDFFASLTSPGIIEIINVLNEWGLFLIGVALILGLFTRLASYAGILLMVLYYLPVLSFPHVEHGYLVDDHVIYMAAFFVLAMFQAGKYWGLDKKRIARHR